MFFYCRYSILLTIFIPTILCSVVLGALWPLVTYAAIVSLHLIFDNMFSLDFTVPTVRHPWILNLILFMHVPVTLMCLFVLLWKISPGDLWSAGAYFQQVTGFEWSTTETVIPLSELILCSYIIGFALGPNIICAHELVHRTDSVFSMAMGRFLLASVSDAQFSISHVYGHHLHVATAQDPATARRGENVYSFFFRSTIGQYVESWAIEKRRLAFSGRAAWWPLNRVITGFIPTLIIAIVFFTVAGGIGLLSYMIVCFVAKLSLEIINFIEHYGLIRADNQPVEKRHSWDCANRGATYLMYNLTRHSHHHYRPRVPFWELQLYGKNKVMLSGGYMANMILALVPPLWNRLMVPRLKYWDEHLANTEEKEIAKKLNATCKIKHLFMSLDASS